MNSGELRLAAVVAPTWTDYLALKGAAEGINRQCSIGWHDECSDPEGEDCECFCHPHSIVQKLIDSRGHPNMTVYLITLTAVYDHGCAGIFTDLEAAKAHCQALWEQSDGHHHFRIDTITVDEPIADTDRLNGWSSNPDANRKKRLARSDEIYVRIDSEDT